MAGTASWDSFKIQLPGKDFLEPVRDILQTILVVLEVLKAILETVKMFLVEFPNPIAALVKALIALITTFFEALNRTGIYAWFEIPDPSTDPNFYRFQGGYPAFVSRFKASLIDTRDPNRPQPIGGATQSGFVCIVADAQGPIELLRLIKILLSFFSKDFLHPKYPPPGNVKILPIGDKGDPILNLARVFQLGIAGVALQWTLGSSQTSPDPGFRDLANAVGAEFIPPNWIIEKSSVPVTQRLTSGSLMTPNVAGQVYVEVDTDHEIRGKPGKRAKQVQRLTDQSGDPIIRFEKVIKIETGSGLGAIIGELGVFKYPDLDVEFDRTYYYRIRAYTGDLPVQDGVIQYTIKDDYRTKRKYASLPNGVVLGKPSPVFRVRVPRLTNFNVLEELKRLFLTAFSLNFHLEAFTGTVFDSDDNPINGPPSEIGRGSLLRQAGILSQFAANPLAGRILGNTGRLTTQFDQPKDAVTGATVPPPWGQTSVTRQAARLAGIVGSAMLEQGSGVIGQFQQIMTGPYPRGTPTTQGKLAGVTNLSGLCSALTFLNDDKLTDNDTFQTYGDAFNDALVRKNVLSAIRFILSFTLGGTPPDWIQVSVLRDIIPWSAQILYDILAKIQALLDAFKSIFDEIKNFIDMLERKIDVLERFIQFLLSILDFILSLSAGFYILKLPQTDGDVFSWMEAIDTAGGTKPPSGPGGYSCGVSFAYIAVDVSAFANAFSLIF